MNDPHVSELYYHLKTSDTLSFKDPSAVEWDSPAYKGQLSDGKLKINMIEHFASESEARSVVEKFLRAWEISAGLTLTCATITFEFKRSEIVDRNPSPPGTDQTVSAQAIGSSEAIGKIAMREEHTSYPNPPKNFLGCPDVETMWQRFDMYRNGKEPLASMAYMCLTVLQAGMRRPEAAKRYQIKKEVLDKLGHLTSTIGVATTARKMPVTEAREYTAEEVGWMEAAVRNLIRRAGEYAYNPDPSSHCEISMKDLPHLSSS